MTASVTILRPAYVPARIHSAAYRYVPRGPQPTARESFLRELGIKPS